MDALEAKKIFSEILSHFEHVEIPKITLKTPTGETETFVGLRTVRLNEEWERKNIKSLVILFNYYLQIDSQLNSDKHVMWSECTEDEASLAKTLIGEAIEHLESRFFSIRDSETVTLSRHDANALFEAALFPRYLHLEKPDNSKLTGREGGLKAARNRFQIRKQGIAKIKEIIRNNNLWDDFSQTAKSITDMIYPEIEAAISNSEGWQGISNADLQQAKIGRQTVYDAVKETDPR